MFQLTTTKNPTKATKIDKPTQKGKNIKMLITYSSSLLPRKSMKRLVTNVVLSKSITDFLVLHVLGSTVKK